MKAKTSEGMVGHLLIITLFVFLIAGPALAGDKKKDPPKTPPISQSANLKAKLTSKQNTHVKTDAEATGIGIGKGGKAIAKGGDQTVKIKDGDTNVRVKDGDQTVKIKDGDVNVKNNIKDGDVSVKNNIKDGDVSLDAGDTLVDAGDQLSTNVNEGDYYSSSYKYEEAAASAAILYGQVCQDTTNLQGVSFGIGSQKQSAFCQRMALATGYLATATMHDCPEAESVLKGGGTTVATPDPTTCQRDQRRAYLSGVEQMDLARHMLDDNRDGFVKKLWNKIW